MSLHFTKVQSCGNDFIILDEANGPVNIEPPLARALCLRNRGVGADGLIAVAAEGPARARVSFYNADGSRAEMCGNGLRCAAHYLRWRHGAAEKLALATDAGTRSCQVLGEPWRTTVEVCADMGVVEMAGTLAEAWRDQRIEIDGAIVASHAIRVGNPHLVLLRPPDAAEVARLGPELSHHPALPGGVNVEWVELVAGKARAAVYERGVGPTLACGSGACAVTAALIAAQQWLPGVTLAVELAGGRLAVTVDADWRARLQGASTVIFDGALVAPPGALAPA
ncbi:MAG: diaminopimelate epimerase [Deltaproteobacteria bacterium]|nr:diaminopimelate epimerase [Deltaproteobacteria bacterium]